MRRIDRLNLIDRVGRELQARMSYSDIDVYLSGFGIDITQKTSPVNSKWIYVKERLANVPEETILKIADELEIEHGFGVLQKLDLNDSKFWLTGHFRLFLSHLSAIKIKAAQLQKILRSYGISAFVAHEDIEPTKEWQDEIEKALFTMNALAAILSPGFKESNWTDQEVGVAVGRDVLIIPIRNGLDPYGFIAKYQGLQVQGKTIGQVAEALFQIIANNPKTKGKMADVLVDQILCATNSADATNKLSLLRKIETLPERHLEKLRDGALENKNLVKDKVFISSLNDILKERGISELGKQKPLEESHSDDIPF